MTDGLDARGCLTDAGLATLAGTPLGEAPPELAQHVASCARCQERWLQWAQPEPRRARPSAEQTARRRWGMTAIVLGVLLFALVALVWTLGYLTGR
jgi:hypothetical protein